MIEEKIKEYFKELVSDECFYTWSDTFDVELVGERRVVVSYHGHQKFKKFKKRCKRMLKKAVRMACGKRRKVKCRKRRKTEQNGQLRKNVKAVKFFVVGMIFLCIATAVMIVMFNYIGNRKFRETFYSVSSLKVDSTVRVIQLSDLHSCSYGEDNEKLLERVKALEPDVIICTGDMVDSAKEDLKDAIQIGKALAEIAPSYYVYGNNEVETIYDFSLNRIDLDQKFGFDDDNRDETALLSIEDSFEEELEKVGIKVLKNEKDTIEIENMKVDVYGVLTSNPSSFWPYSEKSFSEYL